MHFVILKLIGVFCNLVTSIILKNNIIGIYVMYLYVNACNVCKVIS